MSWLKKNKKSVQNSRRRPGNVNPPVFSYYARGTSPSEENTGRNENTAVKAVKRYRLRLGHIPSYIALISVIVALAYSCVLTSNPKIILVNVPDTVHRDPKVYKEAIQATWKKSIFSRTKLTVSTTGIQRDIQNQFTELSTVQVELPLLGRRPTVVLTPLKPTLQLISANGSFYVDANGKVLARITDLTKNDIKDLPVIRDETGVSAEPGKIAIPAPESQFLSRFYAQLKAQNIDIQSIILPQKAANEVDLQTTGLQYIIKFSIESDPRQAVGTYLAAKAKLEGEGVTPAQYIDVRVDEKVFYK